MHRLISIALASFILISNIRDAHALDPQIGRCLDGLCMWTRIIDKQLITERDGARLYRVTYQVGMASHMDKGGACRKQYSFSKAPGLAHDIQWYTPEKAHVFCNNSLPVVMTSVAKVAPLTHDEMNYGRSNVLPIYAPVCHDISPEQFLRSEFQVKNHYKSSGVTMFMVKNPNELFDIKSRGSLEDLKNKI